VPGRVVAMAWTPIQTKLPRDKITSDDLNNQLRGNLAASELEAITDVYSLVGVEGSHALQALTYTENSSSSVFTTSATSPVAIASPTITVHHAGVFMVWWSCTVSITAGEIGYVGPQLSGGSAPAMNKRSVGTSSALSVTETSCHLYYDIVETPKTVQLYGWTEAGGGTLTVGQRLLGAIAM
jgi:hypothetical protein